MGLQNWKIGVVCLGLMMASATHADDSTTAATPAEGETHATISDVVKQKKYDQDTKITDMELNAQNGSLSRYSLQASLGYSGPAIDNLTSTQEPNPLHKRTPAQTNVNGAVGLRYRVSSNDSFYASTGIEGYFQPNGQRNPDVENPSLEYDHTYLVGAVQMSSGVEAIKTTNSYYTQEGETGGVELKQYMKYNVPSTRFILGTELEVQQWLYDRDYKKSDGKGVTDTAFEVIPSLEYKLKRNLNLNTSYSTGWSHWRGINATNTYSGNPGTWWLGVGYGITRDIYLKPYVSFYPQAISWNQTSINMSTYISVF